jgi:hypothetical protein
MSIEEIKDGGIDSFSRVQLSLQKDLHRLPGRSSHVVRDPRLVPDLDGPVKTLLSQRFPEGIILDDGVQEWAGGHFLHFLVGKKSVYGVNVHGSGRIDRDPQVVDDAPFDLFSSGVSNAGF